jgi:hypothetical protein
MIDELSAAGSLTLDNVNALAAATSAEVFSGTGPLLVGTNEAGSAIKRWPLFLFASRRTRDLQAATSFLGDEVLPSFSPARLAALGNGDATVSVGEIAALVQV